jgi:hypothetical protein
MQVTLGKSNLIPALGKQRGEEERKEGREGGGKTAR